MISFYVQVHFLIIYILLTSFNSIARKVKRETYMIHPKQGELLSFWKRAYTPITPGKHRRSENPKPEIVPDHKALRTSIRDSIRTKESNSNKTYSIGEAPGYKHYINPYSATDDILKYIQQALPEANVSSEILGRTAEYNNITLYKISDNNMGKFFRADDDKYSKETVEKKIIFIVHGLSTLSLQFLNCLVKRRYFRELVRYYGKHLDKFDIFMIPIGNPDGFAYIMNKKFKHWNKNRSPQLNCPGVAIDRNFDVGWNLRKQTTPCSHQYSGPSPFSEPESDAVREVFHRFSHKIAAYINVHASSYTEKTIKGDAILYPVGYIENQTDDDKYIDIRGEIEEAMKNASFELVSINVNDLYSWYGGVSGTSVDYASTVYGIPYAMEFVMQVFTYDTSSLPHYESEEIQIDALEEIWQRAIDVVFNHVAKSLSNHE